MLVSRALFILSLVAITISAEKVGYVISYNSSYLVALTRNVCVHTLAKDTLD